MRGCEHPPYGLFRLQDREATPVFDPSFRLAGRDDFLVEL